MSDRLKIGISACLLPPTPGRSAAPAKTLQFIEQSTAHWVMGGGALPVMIPSPYGDTARGEIGCNDYAQWLDGLVLHGGADVWPGSYGEEPLKPEWIGDAARDAYEIELMRAFFVAGKPVFGICRGLQVINVGFGGTLYQDIATQLDTPVRHQDRPVYEHNFHQVEMVSGTRLETLLSASSSRTINSIHHQAIRALAPDFEVEARSPTDGVIEAIRHCGPAYVAAVQWHPEFHRPEQNVLDDTPLLADFLQAARVARQSRQPGPTGSQSPSQDPA